MYIVVLVIWACQATKSSQVGVLLHVGLQELGWAGLHVALIINGADFFIYMLECGKKVL